MLHRWYRSLTLSDRTLQSLVSCLRSIRKDGQVVIPMVSAGIYSLQKKSPDQFEEDFLNQWLDGFFLSRISTNVLADQLVARAGKVDGGAARQTGIINPRCNATDVCENAANIARKVCFNQTGMLPEFLVENYDASSMQPTESPCLFSYIPAYLTYIMVELLKNSFKATVERCTSEEDVQSRPVRILVSRDENCVAILVSDRAGGIPFDVGNKIWSYLYGAAARSADGEAAPSGNALGGFGVGLPLSRLYARYLGGRLHITSYPGYGTQAHLLLPRITVNQVENLPTSQVGLRR
eukprot:TRINITY_DN98656_c0_g1_i1.p1 TRINITY_DN98656_c0_g1~~TRINITY_DN98656_c0_g1_i1.p1  ORF type:complete len:332 (-),score=46.10 TRINITY_DN98656_c0_g1_i1:22-903(-)